MTNTKSLTYIVLAILVLSIAYMFVSYQRADASALSGTPAAQIVATTTQVGPQANVTIFTSKPSCASRIIRTQETDIYLLFGDPTNGNVASTSLTANVGFTQPASTTVAYDSGIYGCGRFTAEASASTTITVAEMY